MTNTPVEPAADNDLALTAIEARVLGCLIEKAATTPDTYHEIRSLGGALLREIGWSVAQVQTIMTHTSEAMTELYLGGREAPWTEVATAATLEQIGRNREVACTCIHCFSPIG